MICAIDLVPKYKNIIIKTIHTTWRWSRKNCIISFTDKNGGARRKICNTIRQIV